MGIVSSVFTSPDRTSSTSVGTGDVDFEIVSASEVEQPTAEQIAQAAADWVASDAALQQRLTTALTARSSHLEKRYAKWQQSSNRAELLALDREKQLRRLEELRWGQVTANYGVNEQAFQRLAQLVVRETPEFQLEEKQLKLHPRPVSAEEIRAGRWGVEHKELEPYDANAEPFPAVRNPTSLRQDVYENDAREGPFYADSSTPQDREVWGTSKLIDNSWRLTAEEYTYFTNWGMSLRPNAKPLDCTIEYGIGHEAAWDCLPKSGIVLHDVCTVKQMVVWTSRQKRGRLSASQRQRRIHRLTRHFQRRETQRRAQLPDPAHALKLLDMIEQNKSRAGAVRDQVSIARRQLLDLTAEIDSRTTMVQEHLQDAEPVLEEATVSLRTIKKQDLGHIAALKTPPDGLRHLLVAVMTLLGQRDTTWGGLRKALKGHSFVPRLLEFDPTTLPPQTLANLNKTMNSMPEVFDPSRAARIARASAPLARWVTACCRYASVAERIQPLTSEVRHLHEKQANLQSQLKCYRAQLRVHETQHATLTQALQSSGWTEQLLKAAMKPNNQVVECGIAGPSEAFFTECLRVCTPEDQERILAQHRELEERLAEQKRLEAEKVEAELYIPPAKIALRLRALNAYFQARAHWMQSEFKYRVPSRSLETPTMSLATPFFSNGVLRCSAQLLGSA